MSAFDPSSLEGIPQVGFTLSGTTGGYTFDVGKPTQIGDGVAAYTAYEVKHNCVASDGTTAPSEGTVLRRYSDFEWLREALSHAYAGSIIPPLPPRRTSS